MATYFKLPIKRISIKKNQLVNIVKNYKIKKMRILKIILFTTIVFLGFNISFAQEISFRGGLNHSQYQDKQYSEVLNEAGLKFNPGFNIGPIFELQATEIFSIETGILLNSKGFKSSYEFRGITVLNSEILYYMEIPVLCKVSIPINKFKIFTVAGVYFAEALHGKRTYGDIENSEKEIWENDIFWGNGYSEYDRFDYGLKFGIGLRYLKWQMGANYDLGLKNIRNAGHIERRNRAVELNLQYTLLNLKSNKK
jgi:hypothetical protein